VTEILAELRGRYAHVDDDEVRRFVDRLAARRCLEIGDAEAGRGQARRG
jgi:pyrroloquinoline quinone biosynthesis protein D